MRNWWAAGTVLLLLSGVGLTVWGDAPLPPDGAPVDPPGSAIASVPQRGERAEPQREAADSVVRGRCFDRDTGAPVTVGTVTFGGRTHVLSSSGEFEVPSSATRLVLHTEDHVATSVDLAAWAADELAIPLRRGVIVTGSLVDAADRPIPGAVVELKPTERTPAIAGLHEHWPGRVEVDPGGAFAWSDPVPPGLVEIRVRRAGELVGPDTFDLRAPLAHLDLRSAGMPLRGRVANGRGHPVAGATVWGQRGLGALGQDRTDEHGGFQVFVSPGEPVDLFYSPPGDAGGLAGPFGPFPVPSSRIELTASGVTTVVLQVVDAETGVPVGGFSTQCVAMDGVGRPSHPAQARVDAAGWARLDLASDGPHRLMVHPEGSEWLPTRPLTFDPAKTPTLTVALQRVVDCPVVVVDEANQPVSGVSVELLTGAAGDRAPVRDLGKVLSQGRGRGLALRLARGVSDEHGVATLAWTDHRDGPLRLRVRGPGVAPLEVGDVILSRVEAVRVVVQRAGAVECQVGGLGDAPFRAVLLGEDGQQFPPAWAGAVEGRGTLRVDSVPVGTWRLRILTPVEVGHVKLGAWGTAAVSDPVRVLPLETSTVAVVVDGSALGEVRGTAFVGGAPSDRVILRVGERVGDTVRAVATVDTTPGSGGDFRFGALQPRLYSLAVCVTVGAGRIDVPLTDWRALEPGESLELELALAVAPVRLRVGPLPTGRLELSSRQFGIVLPPPVAGVVALDAVPTGTYRVRLVDRSGVKDLGPLEVRQGGVEWSLPDR